MKIPNPIRFLRAVARAAWFKLRGYDTLVRLEEEDERLFWCHRCSALDRDFMQCQHCTCWVPAKVKLASEECPRRLWLPIRRKRS